MPSKKAVQSETVVSATSAFAPVPVVAKSKVARKRVTAKATETGEDSATAAKKSTGARKKAAVVADTTTVAAVTHRHKKQETVSPVAGSTPSNGTAPVATAFEPSHDEVAGLAYSYYVARGYQPGDPAADWFRAVTELKQRHMTSSLLSDSK
jgi:hypothetical protein